MKPSLRFRRTFTLSALIVFFAVLTASSTDEFVVNLFVTAVKQDSPVQIVGFKLPSTASADEAHTDAASLPLCRWCPKVLLHNTTARQITDIRLLGLWGDPNRPADDHAGTGGIGILSESKVGQPPPYAIAPNGDAEFGDAVLWPFQMALAGARDVGSNCLQVSVVVQHVEFSDGTMWTSTREQDQAWWRDSLQQGVSPCKDSKEMDLKGLHKGTASTQPPSRDVGITQSYSAACPVRRIDGDLVMQHCTW